MRQTGFTTRVTPLARHVMGDMDRVLWILLGSVALVLLIACANVANLFLVRAEARRRELAVRSALGAARGALAWHALTESLLLCLLAGGLGLFLAHGALRLLVALDPSGLPRVDPGHGHLDDRVPHQLLDDLEWVAPHGEVAAVGVPQVVPADAPLPNIVRVFRVVLPKL